MYRGGNTNEIHMRKLATSLAKFNSNESFTMKPFQIGKHYPKFDHITVDRAVGEINTYAGGTAN